MFTSKIKNLSVLLSVMTLHELSAMSTGYAGNMSSGSVKVRIEVMGGSRLEINKAVIDNVLAQNAINEKSPATQVRLTSVEGRIYTELNNR